MCRVENVLEMWYLCLFNGLIWGRLKQMEQKLGCSGHMLYACGLFAKSVSFFYFVPFYF